MKYVVVCVRDRAADVYGVPVFVASLGSAIRSFGDEINREAPDNQMSKHPDDFDLFELGIYDDATGAFDCARLPKQVAIGKEVKVRTNGS